MKPTNPNNKENPYTCPKCGGPVGLETTFDGWELESIDPRSGEVEEVKSSERTFVHNEEFVCASYKARDCWSADMAEFLDDDEDETDDEQLPESLTQAGEIAIPNIQAMAEKHAFRNVQELAQGLLDEMNAVLCDIRFSPTVEMDIPDDFQPDARTEPDESGALFGCGCNLMNLYDGGAAFQYCDQHRDALDPAKIQSAVFEFDQSGVKSKLEVMRCEFGVIVKVNGEEVALTDLPSAPCNVELVKLFHSPWRDGNPSDAIVAGSPEDDNYDGYYGGLVIAESVSPQEKPLIRNAPLLLALAENAIDWLNMRCDEYEDKYGNIPHPRLKTPVEKLVGLIEEIKREAGANIFPRKAGEACQPDS